MEKLKMHSIDIVNDNFRRLAELFPECVTEINDKDKKTKKVIDFSILSQLIGYNATTYVAETEGGGEDH